MLGNSIFDSDSLLLKYITLQAIKLLVYLQNPS
jgi:hypothetical protein